MKIACILTKKTQLCSIGEHGTRGHLATSLGRRSLNAVKNDGGGQNVMVIDTDLLIKTNSTQNKGMMSQTIICTFKADSKSKYTTRNLPVK